MILICPVNSRPTSQSIAIGNALDNEFILPMTKPMYIQRNSMSMEDTAVSIQCNEPTSKHTHLDGFLFAYHIAFIGDWKPWNDTAIIRMEDYLHLTHGNVKRSDTVLILLFSWLEIRSNRCVIIYVLKVIIGKFVIPWLMYIYNVSQ